MQTIAKLIFILAFIPAFLFGSGKKELIALIVNPISGGKKKEALVKKAVKELSRTYDVEVLYTEGPGHATTLAREALKRRAKIVVAVGGDGSVNEVSQALIGSEAALAILPAGSGNGLARHLGIPLDWSAASAVIAKGKAIPIDTVKINDLYYVGVAGVGFDADISWAFSHSVRRGFLSYLLLTLQEFPRYHPHTYELEIDGKKITREAFLIAFANSSQFGNGVQIAPNADAGDGFLDVVVLRPFSQMEGMRIAYRLFHGTLDEDEHTERIRCKKASIRNKRLRAHIDGEPMCFEDGIHLEIVPSSLNVIIPKQPEESVSAGVGLPPLLSPPASLNFLSLAASAPRTLTQNRGASLASYRFFRLFRYIPIAPPSA